MNSIRAIFDIFSALSTAQWALVGAIWLISQLIAVFLFARWGLTRSWQLQRNLKRRVVILHPLLPSGAVVPGGELRNELAILRANGLLNIRDGVTDYRTFNPV